MHGSFNEEGEVSTIPPETAEHIKKKQALKFNRCLISKIIKWAMDQCKLKTRSIYRFFFLVLSIKIIC